MGNVCGIIQNRLLCHEDHYGCIKQDDNHEDHVFIDQNGRIVSWREDSDCTCGCWDNIENDPEVCLLYHEIILKTNTKFEVTKEQYNTLLRNFRSYIFHKEDNGKYFVKVTRDEVLVQIREMLYPIKS